MPMTIPKMSLPHQLRRQSSTMIFLLMAVLLPLLCLNAKRTHIVSTDETDMADHQSRSKELKSNNNAAFNDESYIKCTNRETGSITNVTLKEFYAEDSRCGHSFSADTVVFHVGKGGGGTLQKQLGIGVQWVHPYPRSSINKQLQSGPLKTLIVNVRDPIDRFVSAFNWRNMYFAIKTMSVGGGRKRLPHIPINFAKKEIKRR